MTAGRSTTAVVIAGIIVALVLAAFVSPFASSAPDGLERVAIDHGIAAAPGPVWDHAAMPDYAAAGVRDGRTATGIAGVLGTLAVLALGLGLGFVLRRRS